MSILRRLFRGKSAQTPEEQLVLDVRKELKRRVTALSQARTADGVARRLRELIPLWIIVDPKAKQFEQILHTVSSMPFDLARISVRSLAKSAIQNISVERLKLLSPADKRQLDTIMGKTLKVSNRKTGTVTEEAFKNLPLAITQHVANRALEHMESQGQLRQGDAQAIFSMLAQGAVGPSAAVEYFYPARLDVLSMYVSQVLLECTKLADASTHELVGEFTRDELLQAMDLVLGTALLTVDAMLKKPVYKALSDVNSILEAVDHLAPQGAGPITKMALKALEGHVRRL